MKKIKIFEKNVLITKLDLLKDKFGTKLIDMNKLHTCKMYSFDSGLTSTAFCKSSITFIDGTNSILLHRGFPIDELANNSTYLELCYILLNGEPPTQVQFDIFKTNIHKQSIVHQYIKKLFNTFSKNVHPMGVLCSALSVMSANFNDDPIVDGKMNTEIVSYTLLAQMPIITAMCYRYLANKPFIQPKKELSYVGNFLHMISNKSYKQQKYRYILEKALDKILILHADHEQNASTASVRTVGSSGTNPFACISAGISSLWGHAHGGANEACLLMLEKIKNTDNIPDFLKFVKSKNNNFKLIGFGHRVYKNYDPRAIIIKKICFKLFRKLKVKDNILDIAVKLEETALKDQYFIDRKLYPNIDFYSGLVLKMLDIPKRMFTAIFAMARTIGWIAHWIEMHNEKLKIIRPRQLYVGRKRRKFKSLLVETDKK